MSLFTYALYYDELNKVIFKFFKSPFISVYFPWKQVSHKLGSYPNLVTSLQGETDLGKSLGLSWASLCMLV